MNRWKYLIIAVFTISLLVACGKESENVSGNQIVDESVTYRLVKIEDYEGEVGLTRNSAEEITVFAGIQLIPEDTVVTGDDALTSLLVDSDKHIGAGENTSFTINAAGTEDNGKVTINLDYGTALFTIDNKLGDNSEFEVITPNVIMAVRGTTFEVNYDPDTGVTTVKVEEGIVWATNSDEEITIYEDSIALLSGDDVKSGSTSVMEEIVSANNAIVSDLAQAKVGDIVCLGQ